MGNASSINFDDYDGGGKHPGEEKTNQYMWGLSIEEGQKKLYEVEGWNKIVITNTPNIREQNKLKEGLKKKGNNQSLQVQGVILFGPGQPDNSRNRIDMLVWDNDNGFRVALTEFLHVQKFLPGSSTVMGALKYYKKWLRDHDKLRRSESNIKLITPSYEWF